MNQGSRSRPWIMHCRLCMCFLLPLFSACSNEQGVATSEGEPDVPPIEMSQQGTEHVDDAAAMQELRSGVGNQPGATALEIASFDAKPLESTVEGKLEDGIAATTFYTVAHYDTKADPAEQLVETLARASSEGKTVLLQVGGDWCVWCKRMTSFIADNAPVNSIISKNYLIQKVTYDADNPNDTFLSAYPKINGYPHLFVLDASGNLLHSQDTSELEEGQGYSEQAFVEFLNKWQPTKGD